MIDAGGGTTLLGRERELGVVLALVDGVVRGVGGSLVVQGAAGIGKSSLLSAGAAAATARGARVLRVTGLQAEAALPFAGLHRLLRPLLPLAERLPPRLRTALLSVFGRSDVTPDTGHEALFLVGLAVLELISEASAEKPTLLVADDTQWVDESSGSVLGFLARRVTDEPAALITAVRGGLEDSFDHAGLTTLSLAALDHPAAGALLDRVAPGVGPTERERVLVEAAGNPLALVELPKSLHTATLRPEQAVLDIVAPVLPLTARLEQSFAAQQSALPETTRAVLLAAAADGASALDEVLAAASAVTGAEVTTDAVLPAIAAGLLEVDDAGPRFCHPLMRSAVYQAAGEPQRRAVHSALADLAHSRPDRRAWHLASATLGPDEQVAADLEAAAVRAVNRSAFSLAADTYRRAATLSKDAPSRTRRLLLAAETAMSAGHLRRGHELLGAAEAMELTAEQRTLAAWMRETSGDGTWSGASQLDTLARLAEQMRSSGETRTALDTLAAFALRCYWGNPDPSTRVAVIGAASRLGLPSTEPALVEILSCADPITTGAHVVDVLRKAHPDRGSPTAMSSLGLAGANAWAWDLAMPLLDAAADGLRTQGQLGLLTRVLTTRAWAAVHLARLPTALTSAAEASRLAVETGQAHWIGANQLAEAVAVSAAGDDATADRLTRQTESLYIRSGSTSMLGFVHFARGRGAMLNQRFDVAVAHLRRVLDPTDPVHHPFVGTWGLADLVEAAVADSDHRAARSHLEQLEHLAAETTGPLLVAQAAYARVLVAPDDDAEPRFDQAVTSALRDWPDLRARMLLHRGERLRRQRRSVEARTPLREAAESFDALGFVRLAERARVQLRAAGEGSSRREPRPWDALTAQELQIARLAADGLSNREIGQQLYISHRTVGAHLYKIFPKLGVTSRSQLHTALG